MFQGTGLSISLPPPLSPTLCFHMEFNRRIEAVDQNVPGKAGDRSLGVGGVGVGTVF